MTEYCAAPSLGEAYWIKTAQEREGTLIKVQESLKSRERGAHQDQHKKSQSTMLTSKAMRNNLNQPQNPRQGLILLSIFPIGGVVFQGEVPQKASQSRVTMISSACRLVSQDQDLLKDQSPKIPASTSGKRKPQKGHQQKKPLDRDTRCKIKLEGQGARSAPTPSHHRGTRGGQPNPPTRGGCPHPTSTPPTTASQPAPRASQRARARRQRAAHCPPLNHPLASPPLSGSTLAHATTESHDGDEPTPERRRARAASPAAAADGPAAAAGDHAGHDGGQPRRRRW